MEPRHDDFLHILILLVGIDHLAHLGFPILTGITHGTFDFFEVFVDRLSRLAGRIRRHWNRHRRK